MSPEQSEFVEFECPGCRKEVSFPEGWNGSLQECPWCFQSVVVPEHSKEKAREVRFSVRTPRLQLRRLNGGDESDLHEIMSDADSFRYLEWEPLDDQGVRDWLEADAKVRNMEPNVHWPLAVELVSPKKVIGLVFFLYHGPHGRQASFSILVNAGFRRQGYGSEIVRGVLDLAFRDLNLRRVAPGCDNRNEAGLKMLEKAGMRGEGEFVEDQRLRDEWVTTVYYALLRREHNSIAPAVA